MLLNEKRLPQYPDCNSTLDALRITGEVGYRICRNTDKPTFDIYVPPAACRLCQSLERSERAKATNEEDNKPPKLVGRIISYAEALIEWTAAGKPERSDDEVQRIFHQCCQPCKRFDGGKQICLECGCRVTTSSFAFLNKIKMATQHCPKGKW